MSSDNPILNNPYLEPKLWDRLYGFQSHPIEFAKGKKVAVKVVSQFGEESMKVVTL